MQENNAHNSSLHHGRTFSEAIREGCSEQTLLADAETCAGTDPESDGARHRVVRVRKNERELNEKEQEAFRGAVESLIANNRTYEHFVLTHTLGKHRMHGSGGFVGLKRFLPWHRQFILEFEHALCQAHVDSGGDPSLLTGLPYWRWNSQDPGFPAWLDGFLPLEREPINNRPIGPRSPGNPADLPGQRDLDVIMNGSQAFLAGEHDGINDFVRFVYVLDGWAKHPDGTDVRAHNHVHQWVGGVMDLIMLSPIDPVFWLLHAEIDRLWHIWQRQHPDAKPPLENKDSVLDPWSVTVDDVMEISDLGYEYAENVP